MVPRSRGITGRPVESDDNGEQPDVHCRQDGREGLLLRSGTDDCDDRQQNTGREACAKHPEPRLLLSTGGGLAADRTAASNKDADEDHPCGHQRCETAASLALGGLLDEVFADMPGTIEHGDLAVREDGEGGRLLPTAIFARWRAN